ncbi:MAG TPA: bifunctional hydroxymethylpyrimidine kinase/phosphomethylpyrimidine kinase [Myxococcota bacterium]|nr:bifunctional hydroxymethylpyrimidine kinase/phosphomethylpyrimidine kinase [Myxococcota bacterium]
MRAMAADLTIMPVQLAVSIAGSDPTGGAGLQLDLQVFRTLGVHGAGVITALTVQDTVKVHRVLPAFPNVVLDQIRVLLRDVTPSAVKLGMLATDDVARAVALGLMELKPPAVRGRNGGSLGAPIVIDPVLVASDGTPLLERRAHGTLIELFARAALVTPNLQEAEQLAERDVSSAAGIENAARTFVTEFGAGAALVKGGHREGPCDDCLALREGKGASIAWLRGERIVGPPVHGTGCALAAAVAAGLASGHDLAAAVNSARAFVAAAIRRAQAAGRGARLLVFP